MYYKHCGLVMRDLSVWTLIIKIEAKQYFDLAFEGTQEGNLNKKDME
jgi:hypothetical protein